jgi:SOS-response transcriptional repressor LexA
MKKISEIISENRKGKHLSQTALAQELNQCGHTVSNKVISKWEKGQSEPTASIFVEICRILDIPDIYEACFGTNPNNPVSQLNEAGQQKVFEYTGLLIGSRQYQKQPATVTPFSRSIKLFGEPVSAGPGNFLTDDCYEMITVGNEVPADADFGVRISGDSMEPRFINGQIVFIHQQNVLENGEIGIFLLDGEAYIKRLQNDSGGHFLVSLNKDYDPIPIREQSDFSILGKVIG